MLGGWGKLSAGAVFAIWSVAFYLTALAYVLEARGQSAAAAAAVVAVGTLLVPIYQTALRR